MALVASALRARAPRSRSASPAPRLTYGAVEPYGSHGSTAAALPRKSGSFGSGRESFDIPDLTEIQTEATSGSCSTTASADQKRKNEGLEGVLREIFPIESYDKTLKLEYIALRAGQAALQPDECRQLRLTYGRPFRVWLRLIKEQPVEEEVYLGDMPIMIGGGEFIINGAERVVVSQLHRSPGRRLRRRDRGRRAASCTPAASFPSAAAGSSCNVTKKDTLSVRIDQSGKFSAMTLLRAMEPEVQPDADI